MAEDINKGMDEYCDMMAEVGGRKDDQHWGYNKSEIDRQMKNLLGEIQRNKSEEIEWRKALLNYTADLLTVDATKSNKQLEDLRRRIT